MRTFRVEVIAFNVEAFKENYGKYINKESKDCYETGIFDMTAPEEVYEEISELTDNFINIV